MSNDRTKPVASLSLDLDNKWSYMKTHGDIGWETYPSYFDIVVPRFLSMLEKREQHITVFIVGQDAALDKNREALASISAAGHEIGNHSFKHEQWLHQYSLAEIETELAMAESNIERVTQQRPVGFRGPGFAFSPTLLSVLSERGYKYDCSTFPTFLGPLARMYYLFTAKLDEAQKEERKLLFGKFTEGFRSLRPYHWEIRSSGASNKLLRLLEIPVTTMPFFKIPIHVSYLLYLGQFSQRSAMTYWKMSLSMCRLFRVEPSLLLHPLDFMGCDDDPDLAFFPAMGQPAEPKLELVEKILDVFTDRYDVVTMKRHAEIAQQTKKVSELILTKSDEIIS